jgi:hypothetical protein
MIRDIFIIRDGLPLLTEHFQQETETFNDKDEMLMMSGFFSALDSLSDQFNGFGNISELKLSNDLKLSFIRDPNINNLIYIASSDIKSDDYEVKKILKKISNSFSNRYNAQMLEKWSGKRSDFKEFKDELSKIYDDNQIVEEKSPSQENQFLNVKPILKINSDYEPEHFFTGEMAIKIFKEIDGEKSIAEIAQKLQYDELEVFNTCKNFTKMGLISFFL